MRNPIQIAVAFVGITIGIANSLMPSFGQTQKPEVKKRFETHRFFDKDERLKVKLRLNSTGYECKQLWIVFQRNTKVLFGREQGAGEFDDMPLVLAADTSIWNYMDAVAALYLYRWGVTREAGYRFMVGTAEQDQVYGPQSELEKERFEKGKPFIRELMSLPEADRKKLETNQPMPFSALPLGMQNSVKEMLEVYEREAKAANDGRGRVAPPDMLDKASFKLERRPASDFNRMFIEVTVPGVAQTGFRVYDYEEKKRERIEEAQRGGKALLYQPIKHEISNEAAKQLAALKRKVSLQMSNVTVPQILRRLHEMYGVAVACDPQRSFTQRADIHWSAISLGEALDKLVKTYSKTEWEWRKFGFLLVRGPENVVRGK